MTDLPRLLAEFYLTETAKGLRVLAATGEWTFQRSRKAMAAADTETPPDFRLHPAGPATHKKDTLR